MIEQTSTWPYYSSRNTTHSLLHFSPSVCYFLLCLYFVVAFGNPTVSIYSILQFTISPIFRLLVSSISIISEYFFCHEYVIYWLLTLFFSHCNSRYILWINSSKKLSNIWFFISEETIALLIRIDIFITFQLGIQMFIYAK